MKNVCSTWYIHIWPIAAYNYEAVPHIPMDRIISIYTLYKSQFFFGCICNCCTSNPQQMIQSEHVLNKLNERKLHLQKTYFQGSGVLNVPLFPA